MAGLNRTVLIAGLVAAATSCRSVPSPFAPHDSLPPQPVANSHPADVNRYPGLGVAGPSSGQASSGFDGGQHQQGYGNSSPTGQPVQPVSLGPAGARPDESTGTVAIVGDQHILLGDLFGYVGLLVKPKDGSAAKDPSIKDEVEKKRTQIMQLMLRQIEDPIPQEQLEAQRKQVIQMLLQQAISTKLMYLDFLREMPAEHLSDIEQRLDDQFDKTQLEPLMEKEKATSLAELDRKLRAYGSSLYKQRRAFAEQVMAFEAQKKNVKSLHVITHDEMLAYYHKHSEDYQISARARWERLMVRLDRFAAKDEAIRALAHMGNQVYYGASLAEVARQSSQGINANEGGYHDWTTKGSLKSEVIDEAIFTLPLNRLSSILEDEDGLHILRVIERQEAGRVPFREAQVKIKKNIQREKRRGQVAAYLARLRQQTRVWTIFDQPPSAHGTADVPDSRGQRLSR